ncbi:MAG: hypothetical protein AAF670_16280 [Planctomycetota bacterium]
MKIVIDPMPNHNRAACRRQPIGCVDASFCDEPLQHGEPSAMLLRLNSGNEDSLLEGRLRRKR